MKVMIEHQKNKKLFWNKEWTHLEKMTFHKCQMIFILLGKTALKILLLTAVSYHGLDNIYEMARF